MLAVAGAARLTAGGWFVAEPMSTKVAVMVVSAAGVTSLLPPPHAASHVANKTARHRFRARLAQPPALSLVRPLPGPVARC